MWCIWVPVFTKQALAGGEGGWKGWAYQPKKVEQTKTLFKKKTQTNTCHTGMNVCGSGSIPITHKMQDALRARATSLLWSNEEAFYF